MSITPLRKEQIAWYDVPENFWEMSWKSCLAKNDCVSAVFRSPVYKMIARSFRWYERGVFWGGGHGLCRRACFGTGLACKLPFLRWRTILRSADLGQFVLNANMARQHFAVMLHANGKSHLLALCAMFNPLIDVK